MVWWDSPLINIGDVVDSYIYTSVTVMVICPHIVVTMCVIVPLLMDVIAGCIQDWYTIRCPISWNLSIEETYMNMVS